MRNRFAGICYRCGETVEPGDGHFERWRSGWRTQHAICAIAYRNTGPNGAGPRPASIEDAERIWNERKGGAA